MDQLHNLFYFFSPRIWASSGLDRANVYRPQLKKLTIISGKQTKSKKYLKSTWKVLKYFHVLKYLVLKYISKMYLVLGT